MRIFITNYFSYKNNLIFRAEQNNRKVEKVDE